MRRILVTTALAAGLIAGSLAPSSLAASATQDAYGGGGAEVTPTPAPGSAGTAPTETQGTAPTATSTGSLPFTGLEAGLIGIAGLGLVGVGITLRRTARQQDLVS